MSKPSVIRLQAFICAAAIILTAFIIVFHISDSDMNKRNLEYISSFGWRVEPKPTDISYFTLPEQFDSVFSAYKSLSGNEAFNPASRSGMKVLRYSYRVLNHKESESGLIRINIFVSENNIVAADISSLVSGGFVLPLSDTSGIQ